MAELVSGEIPVPSIKFLHVADLQFGHPTPRPAWDQVNVLHRLADETTTRHNTVDVIFLTGDIAYRGLEEEYDEAREWLDGLASALSVPPELIFCVAGNHDLDRQVTVDDHMARLLMRGLRDGDPRLDDQRGQAEFREVSARRFAAFQEFVSDFAPEVSHSIHEWHAVLQWTPDGLVRAPMASEGQNSTARIRIRGLNTALLSIGDDRGSLRIGSEPLRSLELTRSEIDQSELSLLLTHHPIVGPGSFWLHADEVEQLAEAAAACDVYMCGHVHATQERPIQELANDTVVRLVSGAVFGDGREDEKQLRVPSTYGYVVGTASLPAPGQWRIELWPKKWSKARQEFQPDHDISGADQLSVQYDLRVGEDSDVAGQTAAEAVIDLRGPRAKRTPSPRPRDLYFRPWLRFVPKRIFLPGDEEFNEDFVEHWNRHMSQTRFYHYRGDFGRVTSAQLFHALPALASDRLSEVKLLLLAPEDRSIRAKLATEPISLDMPIEARVQRAKDELYTTLFGLAEVHNRCPNVTLEISLYREDPSYRMESTESAAYLTYYSQGGTHGNTIYYPSDRAGMDRSTDPSQISMYETHKRAFSAAFQYAKDDFVVQNTPGGLTVYRDRGAMHQALEAYLIEEADHELDYYRSLWMQRLDDLSPPTLGLANRA